MSTVTTVFSASDQVAFFNELTVYATVKERKCLCQNQQPDDNFTHVYYYRIKFVTKRL